MNEEITKAMDALAGRGALAATTGGDTTDWKAKYEEAQRELASAKVEQGRVKKLDEQVKALQAENAKLSSSRGVQSVIDGLPPEMKEGFTEDSLRAQALIAQRAVEAANAERDAQIAQMRAEQAERDRRNAQAAEVAFGQMIEQRYPGFLRSAVAEGGDKHGAWVEFVEYYGPSINAAYNAQDFKRLSWFIEKFYTEKLELPPPSGGLGAAAPDPSATGGGTPTTRIHGDKTYTADEINALFDKKEAARDRGDWAEVKRLSDEINRAQAAENAKK
jgi:hypothetical protein